MSYVITKLVNGRFTYWWGNDNKWEGLKNNAKKLSSQTLVEEEMRVIRRLGLYDNTVYSKGYTNN